MRVAVVGHVEWVEFVRVDRVPRAGQIVHGGDRWEDPAGGGGVAAVQLARLAGRADLFTALGDDELGHRALARLRELGVTVHAAWREPPTRRALTLLDARGERTIVTLGERLAPHGDDGLPWETLADADAVYFTAGDAAALRAARRARVLVASPRGSEALRPGVALDVLVLSANDDDERRQAQELIDAPLESSPGLVVLTEGAKGGEYRGREGTQGHFSAAEVRGPRADSYGCGDSFAAGVTFGLGRGDDIATALELAARCGAVCLTGHGPYGRQLTGEGASGRGFH